MKMQLLTIMFSVSVLVACSEASSREEGSGSAVTVSLQQSVQNISVEEFEKMTIDRPGTILDVRTPEEVTEGYIPGAVNINYFDEDFAERADQLDKTKPVYVYCRSGARSAKAAKVLSEKGFTQVYNLDGGFMQWEAKGKKVSR